MNDDRDGLSLEDEKISKITDAIQKDGRQEFRGAFANVGIEVMPQMPEGGDSNEDRPVLSPKSEPTPSPAPPTSTPISNVPISEPPISDAPLSADPLDEPLQKSSSLIQSLRTYERDVAESIRAGQTKMSINLAEQKRRLEQNQNRNFSAEASATEKVARGSLLFIASGILIAAALGTLIFTFYFKNPEPPVRTVEIKTIISMDDSKEVVLPSVTFENIVPAVEKTLAEIS